MAVDILTNAVNFYMPGIKYLIAIDMTDLFITLASKFNPEVAFKLIGIPDRWYLYALKQDGTIKWLDKTLASLGEKVRMEDEEVVDFLRRIKATYGIFQILTGASMRFFGTCITN